MDVPVPPVNTRGSVHEVPFRDWEAAWGTTYADRY